MASKALRITVAKFNFLKINFALKNSIPNQLGLQITINVK